MVYDAYKYDCMEVSAANTIVGEATFALLTLSITASANELKQKGVDIVAFTAVNLIIYPEHIQESGWSGYQQDMLGIRRQQCFELRKLLPAKNDNGLDYTQSRYCSANKHSLCVFRFC